MIFQKHKPYEYTVTYGPFETKRSKIYFSNKELEHLAIAALLVCGVGLSLGFSIILKTYSIIAFAGILTASFLLHEIAHKITAQREGLWAEFRLTLFGAVLTLVSIIIPVFKIISPGAVMIAGLGDTKRTGEISIAGPSTNITLSVVFFALSAVFPQFVVFPLAAFFNAWMAVFNLIPFGILDGYKVFNWNKIAWVLAFIVSLILLIFSLLLPNMPSF
jgi:Zn-dependent protease